MKALIVDSSALIIERLQVLLMETGKITAAFGAVSGKDGERLFKEVEPDLVLLDTNLPANASGWLMDVFKKKPVKVIGLSFQPESELENGKTGIDYLVDKYMASEEIPGIINCISGNQNHC